MLVAVRAVVSNFRVGLVLVSLLAPWTLLGRFGRLLGRLGAPWAVLEASWGVWGESKVTKEQFHSAATARLCGPGNKSAVAVDDGAGLFQS